MVLTVCAISIVQSEDLYSVDLQFAQQNLQIAQIPRLQGVYTLNTVDSKYRGGHLGHKKCTNNVISHDYSIINCFMILIFIERIKSRKVDVILDWYRASVHI